MQDFDSGSLQAASQHPLNQHVCAPLTSGAPAASGAKPKSSVSQGLLLHLNTSSKQIHLRADIVMMATFFHCIGSAWSFYLYSPPFSSKGIEMVLSLTTNTVTSLCNFAEKVTTRNLLLSSWNYHCAQLLARQSHSVFWAFLMNWLFPLGRAALWHLWNKHFLCCAHISMKIKQQIRTHSQKHKSVNCWNVLQHVGFSKADVKAL